MADKPSNPAVTARLREAVEKRAHFEAPGGFTRCVTFLATKGVTGEKAKRICASFHHDVTGKWPGEGHE
jgi:hypothetical protein